MCFCGFSLPPKTLPRYCPRFCLVMYSTHLWLRSCIIAGKIQVLHSSQTSGSTKFYSLFAQEQIKSQSFGYGRKLWQSDISAVPQQAQHCVPLTRESPVDILAAFPLLGKVSVTGLAPASPSPRPPPPYPGTSPYPRPLSSISISPRELGTSADLLSSHTQLSPRRAAASNIGILPRHDIFYVP